MLQCLEDQILCGLKAFYKCFSRANVKLLQVEAVLLEFTTFLKHLVQFGIHLCNLRYLLLINPKIISGKKILKPFVVVALHLQNVLFPALKISFKKKGMSNSPAYWLMT